MKVDRKTFYTDIYHMVSQIPYGKVCTYGMLARLAGWPGYSRMVGRALSEVPCRMNLPCHRVVNGKGRLAPHWPDQKALLEQEGIQLKANHCVDLKVYSWDLF